jgi:hypothetical protein
VDVEKVLAIDVVVGKVTKMDFIERHLRGMVDHVVAGEEREEDYREEDRRPVLGELRRLRLREGLILVEHVA